MSYSPEVLADSPAVYFRMQEASGLIQDSSGNARHATANSGSGSATYRQPGPIQSDPGDYSILFNSYYFTVPDQAGLDLADVFTLECWMKRTVLGTEDFIVCKGNNSYALEVGRLLDDKVLLGKYGIQDLATTSSKVENTTSWHHLVATKSGTISKVYVNAVDVTVPVLDSTCLDTILNLFIGASTDGTSKSTSYLDEVAVYPTALSAARVLAHYNAAFNPAPADYAQFPKAKLRTGV